MGYIDALTSSCFKTAQDGSKLFFPWGTLGRGYVIPSQPVYERLQRQVSAVMALTLPVSITVVVLSNLFGLTIAALAIVLCIACAMVWARYVVRGLQPATERLSLQESITSQARLQSPALLWSILIVSIAFVGAGIYVWIINPRNWLTPVAAISFFGFGAAFLANMLVVRRKDKNAAR
jgi:hypothetical protein